MLEEKKGKIYFCVGETVGMALFCAIRHHVVSSEATRAAVRLLLLSGCPAFLWEERAVCPGPDLGQPALRPGLRCLIIIITTITIIITIIIIIIATGAAPGQMFLSLLMVNISIPLLDQQWIALSLRLLEQCKWY